MALFLASLVCILAALTPQNMPNCSTRVLSANGPLAHQRSFVLH
jgi:hypothetical protein